MPEDTAPPDEGPPAVKPVHTLSGPSESEAKRQKVDEGSSEPDLSAAADEYDDNGAAAAPESTSDSDAKEAGASLAPAGGATLKLPGGAVASAVEDDDESDSDDESFDGGPARDPNEPTWICNNCSVSDNYLDDPVCNTEMCNVRPGQSYMEIAGDEDQLPIAVKEWSRRPMAVGYDVRMTLHRKVRVAGDRELKGGAKFEAEARAEEAKAASDATAAAEPPSTEAKTTDADAEPPAADAAATPAAAADGASGTGPAAESTATAESGVSRDLQLQSIWRIPTAAVG